MHSVEVRTRTQALVVQPKRHLRKILYTQGHACSGLYVCVRVGPETCEGAPLELSTYDFRAGRQRCVNAGHSQLYTTLPHLWGRSDGWLVARLSVSVYWWESRRCGVTCSCFGNYPAVSSMNLLHHIYAWLRRGASTRYRPLRLSSQIDPSRSRG